MGNSPVKPTVIEWLAMSDTVTGIIERVTFHNPENGFAVLRVQVPGQSDPLTVVGELPRVVVGEHLEATGTWRDDPEHGRQLHAQTMKTTPPTSAEGIRRFLSSRLIKGIGPSLARKIVDVFGDRTLQIIDESPTFLKEIKGIGASRIQQIRESWKQQKTVRDIMVFLHSYGLGTGQATRIYKTYGDKAIEKVTENPYRLASDVWGIGFQIADQLAQNMGIDRNSPLRARAALKYTLEELTRKGHCAFPQDGVLAQTVNLTGISADIVTDAVAHLIERGELKREERDAEEGGPWLYLRHLHEAETEAARGLLRLCEVEHPLPKVELDKALDWVEKKMGLTLAPTQREAIRQATTSKVLVITGGPGVGKTTIVRGILEIFRAKKLKCTLCAPTGRAAKRLTETTGQEAFTIHRLLEYQAGKGKGKPQPNRDERNPLKLDLLIVDEMSMVDMPLMYYLVRALPSNACVVLVGDIDQLPSVGPGQVLRDIIQSEVIPVVRLTEIFRQAEQSLIVQAAYHVLQGQMPATATQEKPGDFYTIDVEPPAAIIERMVMMVCDRIPKRFGLDSFRDIQVLTPMNRGDLGTKALNQHLQSVLNPLIDDGPEVEKGGWKFRIGDKVLQTINNYDKEVFNGDIGRVKAIDMGEENLNVDFDGRSISYEFEELDELSLAYALTIHKSQGSEYPAVVLAMHTQHFIMLQRNLLYTGITRGKKLVVLIGPERAVSLAVRRQDTSKRYTALAMRLRALHRQT